MEAARIMVEAAAKPAVREHVRRSVVQDLERVGELTRRLEKEGFGAA